MRKADVASALALLGAAAVAVLEGLRLGTGWSTDGPQPGFFVFYLGLALAAASVAVLGQAALRPHAPRYGKPFLATSQVRPVATVVVPAVLMVGLTHAVGLYVAGGVYLAAYMRVVGGHRWALTALLGVGIPVVTFLVFEVWFLVPLPKGPLETYLGY